MSKRSQKTSRYVFVLEGIKTDKVDQKYGINTVSGTVEKPPQHTTKLVELAADRATPETVSFLDESKRMHKCNVSMVDFNSGRSVQLLRYNCFWDRHPFDSKPLGIPIRYVSKQATKSYYSEISKDTYTIKENITDTRSESIDDDRISVRDEEYYESDGVVCSWNCMAAFIEHHKHEVRYRESKSLMLKMYNDMMGTVAIAIEPAPHWNQLIEYGGWRSIVDFRNGFNKADYDCHGIVKSFPEFRPIGVLYEERIRF